MNIEKARHHFEHILVPETEKSMVYWRYATKQHGLALCDEVERLRGFLWMVAHLELARPSLVDSSPGNILALLKEAAEKILAASEEDGTTPSR